MTLRPLAIALLSLAAAFAAEKAASFINGVLPAEYVQASEEAKRKQQPQDKPDPNYRPQAPQQQVAHSVQQPQVIRVDPPQIVNNYSQPPHAPQQQVYPPQPN